MKTSVPVSSLLDGVISERDYTRKVALRGKSSRETRVREILSSRVVSVTPADSVEECMRLMTEHRVRHLPVLEGKDVVGIISIGDLVNWTISARRRFVLTCQIAAASHAGFEARQPRVSFRSCEFTAWPGANSWRWQLAAGPQAAPHRP